MRNVCNLARRWERGARKLDSFHENGQSVVFIKAVLPSSALRALRSALSRFYA
jgi:hypothetical protein